MKHYHYYIIWDLRSWYVIRNQIQVFHELALILSNQHTNGRQVINSY